ncbi:hypothetical protein DFH28DRAFT_921849 [Melampsora americana]|nr:hypothetical protein DFH28DRAFT_921849 [Melampsora americana]
MPTTTSSANVSSERLCLIFVLDVLINNKQGLCKGCVAWSRRGDFNYMYCSILILIFNFGKFWLWLLTQCYYRNLWVTGIVQVMCFKPLFPAHKAYGLKYQWFSSILASQLSALQTQPLLIFCQPTTISTTMTCANIELPMFLIFSEVQ